MPEFNLYHIDRITEDVLRQEIGYSHLFHDLVDHICCDVENHMQQGMSFEEAYHMVKARIGSRGLKQIQEETLYIVDTKYRSMKNLMKISGVSGTVMIGFAAILKIAHLPFAGILLSLGALALAFLFLPSALTVLWKETKNGKKLILFISAFLAGVGFIFGMLFKIQHWPGSEWVISFGMLTGVLIFLPALLIHLFRDKEKKHKRFLYAAGALSILIYVTGFWFRIMHWPNAGWLLLVGSLLLFFIVLPFFTYIQWKEETHVNARFIFMVLAPLLFILPGALVNLNLERIYEEGFYIRLEKQSALIDLQKDNNNRILDIYNNIPEYPQMASLHSEAEKATGLISQIMQNMAVIALGTDKKQATVLMQLSGSENGSPIPYRKLSTSSDIRPVSELLLPGCQARQNLEKELDLFKDVLVKLHGAEWIKQYQQLFSAAEYLPGNTATGSSLQLFPYLNSLSLLESGILITESAALKQIVIDTKGN